MTKNIPVSVKWKDNGARIFVNDTGDDPIEHLEVLEAEVSRHDDTFTVIYNARKCKILVYARTSGEVDAVGVLVVPSPVEDTVA